jgi:hypothetical protein
MAGNGIGILVRQPQNWAPLAHIRISGNRITDEVIRIEIWVIGHCIHGFNHSIWMFVRSIKNQRRIGFS